MVVSPDTASNQASTSDSFSSRKMNGTAATDDNTTQLATVRTKPSFSETSLDQLPRLITTSIMPRNPVTNAEPMKTFQSGLFSATSAMAGGNMNTVKSSIMMPMTNDTRLKSTIGDRRGCVSSSDWPVS